jgi:hypothetical protein
MKGFRQLILRRKHSGERSEKIRARLEQRIEELIAGGMSQRKPGETDRLNLPRMVPALDPSDTENLV